MVSVREHIEALFAEKDKRDQQRFDAQTNAVNSALVSAEKAVTKAETAAEKRFELLNELRGGVATKEQFEALEKQLNDLAGRVERSEGRAGGMQSGWGYLLGAVTLVSLIVAVVVALSGR